MFAQIAEQLTGNAAGQAAGQAVGPTLSEAGTAAAARTGGTPAPAWMSGPVADVWNFALLDLQGTPITLGSLFVAAVVLVVGVLVSRLVSRVSVGVFAKRVTAHPGAIAAVRSLVFYLLCALVLLMAFKVANVPVGIFAVAGGAIAIGVGFGSQNILNNFISGVILLVERPIRVGDVVQLDGANGVKGLVRRIGARSTHIVTGENIDIVVPNSTLLQNNVVNWTLTNDEVRASIAVGVAYGSSLETAKALMLEVAAGHEKVLKVPTPVVLLEDFGDNAIVMQLYFWIKIRRAFERKTVESDLRFEVDRLFRGAGVVIAFPQRDLHLMPGASLEVKMARSEERA